MKYMLMLYVQESGWDELTPAQQAEGMAAYMAYGEALEKASAAALAHTGGGKVTETEQGDEDSYYEVEVTLPDGSQVDVQLDRDFNVVGDEADNDSGDDD